MHALSKCNPRSYFSEKKLQVVGAMLPPAYAVLTSAAAVFVDAKAEGDFIPLIAVFSTLCKHERILQHNSAISSHCRSNPYVTLFQGTDHDKNEVGRHNEFMIVILTSFSSHSVTSRSRMVAPKIQGIKGSGFRN